MDDIFICLDSDGFILGAARSLEGAKSLVHADTPGATLAWHESSYGGYCTIDRHNGWGPQDYATIDRQTLID